MKRLHILLPVFAAFCCGNVSAEPPQQTRLVYQLDPEFQREDRPVNMKELIAAIDHRINPGWFRLFKNVRVRQLDARRIEITVSSSKPEIVQRIERLLKFAGTLEFRILANERDHKSLIERAGKEKGDRLHDAKGNLIARWVPLQEGEKPEDKQRVESILSYREIAKRTVKRDGREVRQVLVVKDSFDVDGTYLDLATHDRDPRDGSPCIAFVFNKEGGKLFGGLTGNNLPDKAQDFYRKLGIILNGKLYSAPRIMGTVYDRGQITGSFTKQEVQDLVDVLNAGALPVAIRKVERTDTPKP